MKKFLELSSWRTALGNLLPSAHGHQGGSRKAAIGSMFIMAFAVVGCDDSSSASAGPNDEPGVESSSSSVIASETKQSSSSSSVDPISSSSLQGDKRSSSSGEKETSSSSVKSSSSSSVILSASEESSSSGSEDKVNCSELLEGETGWSWDVPKECRFNPDIDYGEMTDERDGKVYRTVKIGDQTWMAENLNYVDSVTTPSLKGKSWCYDNEAKNCDIAGRLYTWAAAIDSVKLANDADNPQDCGYGKTCEVASAGSATLIQGICPSGWHLPSNEEWSALFTAVGGQLNAGKVLKSQTGWYSNGNGTDAFGFSALPAGDRYYSGGFDYDGYHAYFWSATEDNSGYAYSMFLYYYSELAYLGDGSKNYGFSVRCLKD